MYRILKELGTIDGHESVKIYELEELGLVAVDFDRADGTNMNAWKCDSQGTCIENDDNMILTGVNEPVSYDDDGEPAQYELVGFELN